LLCGYLEAVSLRDRPLIRRSVRMNERYSDDGGGYLSAAIAYYGFLSFFPLVLLALSVIGFVLDARPDLQERMQDAVAESVPGLEALVGRNLQTIADARAGAGVVGLVGLLWTGTGVVGAGRHAVRRVFRDGPPKGGWGDKVWLVGVTIGLGLIALVATGLAGTAASLDAGGSIGIFVRLAGGVVAFGLDLGLFLLAYRVLGGKGKAWRRLLPGAIFAAVGWTILKLLGTWYAAMTVERSGSVYGPFAATIGVLVILYLAARLFVYGAELNAVLIEEKGGGPMGGPNGGRTNTNPVDVSTVRLVGQVAGDVGTLVKKEVELARQEITEALMARVKAIAAFVVIGVIAMFIVGFLGAAGAAALAQVLPLWLSLLIVAGAFLLLAGIAAMFGITRLKKPPLKPEKTKQTIKEDMEWAKAQLRR
jgi:inner membrane protein YhjD